MIIGEGEIGKLIRKEQPHLAGLISRFEGSAYHADDVGCEDDRIPVLGVQSEQPINLDLEVRLLPHLADDSAIDGFTPVHVARRKRPKAFARIDGPAPEHKLAVDRADANGHQLGIFVVDESALGARRPLVSGADLQNEGRGALWAIFHGRNPRAVGCVGDAAGGPLDGRTSAES